MSLVEISSDQNLPPQEVPFEIQEAHASNPIAGPLAPELHVGIGSIPNRS
jgi:hypothetical protein